MITNVIIIKMQQSELSKQECIKYQRLLISQTQQFIIKEVYSDMQEDIINLNKVRARMTTVGLNNCQGLSDSQVDSIELLQNLQVNYDVMKQKHFIQVSQTLFFKIQRQVELQRLSVHKIIMLFRSYKWRRNNRRHLFRRKFIKEVLKICRMRVFAFNVVKVIMAKNNRLAKIALGRITLKASLQKMLNTVDKTITRIKKTNKIQAMNALKCITKCNSNKCELISRSLSKITSRVLKDCFKRLSSSPYSLTVTSPSGTRKKMSEISIDVINVNESSISDGGNTSTSNVKNLMSKGDERKSFSNKEGMQNQGQVNVEAQKSVSGSSQKQKEQSDPIQKQKVNALKSPPVLQKPIPKKQNDINQQRDQRSQLYKSKVSQLSNQMVSVLNSVLSCSMVSFRSQGTQRITKLQLTAIKDSPFFSFQSWGKEVGAVLPQQQSKPCAVLFRKYEAEKVNDNQQEMLIVNEDKVFKDKIISAPFMIYLQDNLNMRQQETVQSLFTFQKKGLQRPLLKHYDTSKLTNTYKQTFNNMLKLSLTKNTSKKLYQILNLLTAKIRSSYKKQKSTLQTVFDNQPLMNPSYESEYNVLRDEMFLQFGKQIMGNEDEDSLNSLSFALQIVTKSYWPSIKLFYPFMNFVKTHQLQKPHLFSRVYQNLIKFAQAVEGYKGASYKIYKQQCTPITQGEFNQYLQLRNSQFFMQQGQLKQLNITVQLYNRQVFEFSVRNQSFRTIKRRLLFQLGFLNNQKNFGLYEQRTHGNYVLVQQKQKAIDYLSQKLSTSLQPPRLHLRIKHYYPIRFRDINSLRMFYLTMVSQQCRLPYKRQDYEYIVALGISFDQFQQTRIGNYMLVAKKDKLLDGDLVTIKEKLEEMAELDSDTRICQLEYFKMVKEFNFLLAKTYKRVKDKEKPFFIEEIDNIIIKPKQLCFYSSTQLKASISLYRIKSFYFENQQLHIDLIYSDRELGDGSEKKFHGSIKNLLIQGFYKLNQLYQDIVYYAELLQSANKLV